MSDKLVLDLEFSINKGLQEINKPNYKALGILSNIYEEGFFIKKRECPDAAISFGCARRSDNIIKIRGSWDGSVEGASIPETIVHETAHKLHFYNNGEYKLIPRPKTNFENEWKSSLGNLSSCPIPIRIGSTGATWADGTAGPLCGFVSSYGAYNVEKGEVYEDVATFEEKSHFGLPPNLPNDPRYNQKSNLLKKHGF